MPLKRDQWKQLKQLDRRTVCSHGLRRFDRVPKEVFVRADIFEDELRRIFYGNEWMVVGHVSEIPNPGDFKTVAVGRVPLLITRNLQGDVHVFFNACSHRANQLETATRGNKKTFTCPYHRWALVRMVI